MDEFVKTDKPILFLSGGTMSGVFTVGVLRMLEEANAYDKIGAIYSASGGVINGAAFLTKQTTAAVKGYTKDMTKGFIHPENMPRALWQRLWWPSFKKSGRKPTEVVDIDYLMDYLIEQKALDFDAVAKSKIPLYGSLLDVDSGAVEYHDVRKDPKKVVKAAICITPYYSGHETIGGRRYVDGAIAEPIPLDLLKKRYPNNKIILILNHYWKWGVWKYLRTHFEGFFAGRMFGEHLRNAFIHMEERGDEALKEAFAMDNTLVITPPRTSRTISQTTNPLYLSQTLGLGKREAPAVLKFLGINGR